jgi:adenylate cyclase
VSAETLKQRLAAILAADAAGYSRLMAADERATVAALDAARAVFRRHVAAHQGRVIDMAGDSVLAVFETAAGAVSAALAIQRELDAASKDAAQDRRLCFRIGVQLGDVIEKADGSVYGDGVNVAARLQGLSEPGGITVSESIRSAVRGKISATFEDQGAQTVKNIAEPVRAYRVTAGAAEASPPKRSAADIDLSLPDKPSIAVLPFTNMSGDPEQEYFTDGVTEDIITELSRFHSLFVIARNSTFSYKGKSPDIRQVGKELGVRYVLEGSIRKAAKRIRVTAQLIDSLTGIHIWAEKYDRVLEDVFEVQEEVTRAIVTEISPKVHAVELEKVRRRRPENLSAYEIAVRANASAWEAMIKSDQAVREQAIREAREALALDPRSSLALGALAFAQWQQVLHRTTADLGAAHEEALAAATTAIEADPSDSNAHTLKAWLLMWAPEKPRWDESLGSARRAFELNPNGYMEQVALGNIEAYVGNARKGIEILSNALRTSPRDALSVYLYQGLATACCLCGEYASGVDYGERGLNEAPGFGFIRAHLAVNYVGAGEIDKAKAQLETVQRLLPNWAASRLRGEFTFRRPEDVRRYTTFLRVAAGLEAPSAADAVR